MAVSHQFMLKNFFYTYTQTRALGQTKMTNCKFGNVHENFILANIRNFVAS